MDTAFTATSFQVVVKSNFVFPQPHFLQIKQHQYPQLFLISFVLSLVFLLFSGNAEQLNIRPVVRDPKLNRGVQCHKQGEIIFQSYWPQYFGCRPGFYWLSWLSVHTAGLCSASHQTEPLCPPLS